MKPHLLLLATFSVLVVAVSISAAELKSGNPADDLPSHITHLTTFGERVEWSHDGKKILFLSKMFGDAMEIDVKTKAIRNLTQHYPHHGCLRAMYLANGDILLSSPETFDPKNANYARRHSYLYVLDKSLTKPAVPLGVLCNEGPAVSRKRMHIAWSEWTDPKPGEGNTAFSKMYEADIVYTKGVPALANRRTIIDGADLPMRCTMEPQNFRPPGDEELIFSSYTDGGRYCDVLGIYLESKKITYYTKTADIYDEPEGIFPDGKYTLVECDRQNPKGSGYIDIWKLRLDGSGDLQRLTYFSDYPGFKASNPVVSDDGRFIGFQIGKSADAPGIGHGLFIYDIEKAAKVR